MDENDITIKFTKEDVKKYLDDMINFWRENRNMSKHEIDISDAECYIDAYQSVRSNLFGKLKDE